MRVVEQKTCTSPCRSCEKRAACAQERAQVPFVNVREFCQVIAYWQDENPVEVDIRLMTGTTLADLEEMLGEAPVTAGGAA